MVAELGIDFSVLQLSLCDTGLDFDHFRPLRSRSNSPSRDDSAPDFRLGRPKRGYGDAWDRPPKIGRLARY